MFCVSSSCNFSPIIITQAGCGQSELSGGWVVQGCNLEMGGWWQNDGSNDVIDTVFTRPNPLLVLQLASDGSNDLIKVVFTRPDSLLVISNGSNNVINTVCANFHLAQSIFSLGPIRIFTLEFSKAIKLKGVLMIRYTDPVIM